ncbi:MAG: SCO family protein [Vulcanimicrobiaceae bacterium]
MGRLVLALLLVLGAGGNAGAAPSATATQLVDQRGDRFTFAQLRGRPVVVTFISSRCTDTCPISNGVFAAIARDLVQRRLGARLVTITLDPNYDTPFVMARFARAFDAAPDRWRFASGRPADVVRVMHAFGVTAKVDARGEPSVHSSFVYVVDSTGRLTRTFLLSTQTESQVVNSLASVSR